MWITSAPLNFSLIHISTLSEFVISSNWYFVSYFQPLPVFTPVAKSLANTLNLDRFERSSAWGSFHHERLPIKDDFKSLQFPFTWESVAPFTVLSLS